MLHSDRLVALAALRRAAACRAAAGAPQSFDDALARFAADSFADTEAAIERRRRQRQPAGGAGDRGAAGRHASLFDPQTQKVFIRDGPTRLIDAATGQPVAAPPADLKPVRINNRLRRAIDAALGGLTLLAPDPAKRLRRRAGGVQVARR